MSDELRSRYGISKKVNGVVITHVDPKSDAAEKDIKEGQVIVEVTQQEVSSPSDVTSRLETVEKEGRKSVLLLISDAKGDLRFVAIPIKG